MLNKYLQLKYFIIAVILKKLYKDAFIEKLGLEE